MAKKKKQPENLGAVVAQQVAANLKNKKKKEESTTPLVILVENGKRKALFNGVPKACLGRKYSAVPEGPCEGGKRSTPCRWLEDCKKLMSARLAAGISDPDDLRVPVDFSSWNGPEHWQDPEPEKKPKKKKKGKPATKIKGKKKVGTETGQPAPPKETPKVVEAQIAPPGSPEPSAQVKLLTPPKETTITGKELEQIEAAIEEIERRHVVTRLEYYMALGRQLQRVYLRMIPAEFSAWLTRMDLGRATATRYIQLAHVMDVMGKEAQQTILAAPRLTLQKFDALLQIAGPEHLLDVVAAKVTDNKGLPCTLPQLPLKQMTEAAKNLIHQTEAKDIIQAAVDRAETLDRMVKDRRKNKDALPPIQPLEGEVLQPEDAPNVTDLLEGSTGDIVPFNPVEALITVSAVVRQWKKAREKIDTGNICILSRQDRKVLDRLRVFLRDVLIPDLGIILDGE